MQDHFTAALFPFTDRLTRRAIFICLLLAGACHAQPAPPGAERASREQAGITHTPLLKAELADTARQEVIVWDTEYQPGAKNPRHFHPAAVTFHVLSGTGVWQEEGGAPVTLKAGDTLTVAAGTVHSHWNPSTTERLRFLEFIVAEKEKGRSVPRP